MDICHSNIYTTKCIYIVDIFIWWYFFFNLSWDLFDIPTTCFVKVKFVLILKSKTCNYVQNAAGICSGYTTILGANWNWKREWIFYFIINALPLNWILFYIVTKTSGIISCCFYLIRHQKLTTFFLISCEIKSFYFLYREFQINNPNNLAHVRSIWHLMWHRPFSIDRATLTAYFPSE